MGGQNPYGNNMALPQQVQSAYTNALGTASQLPGIGQGVLGQAGQLSGQAAGMFSEMGGTSVPDVTAERLGDMDLSEYMNPYTQNVIDTTMNDLNTQYGVQRQGIDDQAAAQNAFGGDRQHLQSGVLGGKFLDTKARTLADLNSKNFLNAQGMGQFDINNRLNADTGNANRRAGTQQAGASGLGGLASLFGGVGSDLLKGGVDSLGNLANLGFGWGDSLQKNQLAMGAIKTQQQQQLIDAIRAQYAGYTGAPQNALSSYLGAILDPNGYGKQTSDPSLIQGAGSILGGIGAVLPW